MNIKLRTALAISVLFFFNISINGCIVECKALTKIGF